MTTKGSSWSVCMECRGLGKVGRRLRKKIRLRYKIEYEEFESNKDGSTPPSRPKAHLHPCTKCNGSGLVSSTHPPVPDGENFPNVAIIGGGIGGMALAVACLHRGIPFQLFERDQNFESRSQGYGLTLQQASKAIEGLGIFSLDEKVISTRHVVHTTDGKIIGEWGMRKWIAASTKPFTSRTNMHIARQSLRFALLKELSEHATVRWGHQFNEMKQIDRGRVQLSFQVDGATCHYEADLVVGSDGIRSAVRKTLIDEKITPLRYLGCIVILGICSLKDLQNVESTLLDSATVFQTANGNERIYVMPFTPDSVMWQLSFPLEEGDAKKLSELGVSALKEEARRRTQWHDPIPQIIAATSEAQISGYPVYDRELLTPELLEKGKQVTLIGDAAHPMSPFKGQGANQALLDALLLARSIYKECRPPSNWRDLGIRASVLTNFEKEMIERSSSKVKDSNDAAQFLHSSVVLDEGDGPRGRGRK